MTRTRTIAAVVTVAVTAAAGAGAVGWGTVHRGGASGAAAEARSSEPASDRHTATVERRDIVATISVNGTVGYVNQRAVSVRAGAVVTALPAPGTVLDAGGTLFDVNGHAGPILLSGVLPMWRTIESGVDDGADVYQVEANLAFMGFAADGLEIDSTFTWSTRQTIRNFQKAHGLEQSGTLSPSDVWFTAEAVRVGAATVPIGDVIDGPVLTVTGAAQVIRAELEPDQVQYAARGATVTIGLPDRSTVSGKISSIADTAIVTPGDNGSAATTTIPFEITPDRTLPIADGSSVVIDLVTAAASGVLAVPVDAIVATTGGQLALEVLAGATTNLVTVTAGRAAGGWVEIIGDVSEGDTVVTA